MTGRETEPTGVANGRETLPLSVNKGRILKTITLAYEWVILCYIVSSYSFNFISGESIQFLAVALKFSKKRRLCVLYETES